MKGIDHARSDGFMLRSSPSFEERALVTKGRADELSNLYASTRCKEETTDKEMDLNRKAVFNQNTGGSSIASALSCKIAAEKWAQDRQEKEASGLTRTRHVHSLSRPVRVYDLSLPSDRAGVCEFRELQELGHPPGKAPVDTDRRRG